MATQVVTLVSFDEDRMSLSLTYDTGTFAVTFIAPVNLIRRGLNTLSFKIVNDSSKAVVSSWTWPSASAYLTPGGLTYDPTKGIINGHSITFSWGLN